MTYEVVFINGPAGSGKDAAASFLFKNFRAQTRKFAAPIERAIKATYNIGDQKWRVLREQEKDVPSAIFFGLSLRQVMISFSEDWFKKMHQPEVFGFLATRELPAMTSNQLIAFSDCGFEMEALPIVEIVKPAHCLLLQLHREGCTFEGDSRSYIELAQYGVTTIEINNNHSLDMYERQVCKAVRDHFDIKPLTPVLDDLK